MRHAVRILFRLAYGWMALLCALDILTTLQALAVGAHETNPLLAPVLASPVTPWLSLTLLIVLKAFALGVAILITHVVRVQVGMRICAQYLLPAWMIACVEVTAIVVHNWLLAH